MGHSTGLVKGLGSLPYLPAMTSPALPRLGMTDTPSRTLKNSFPNTSGTSSSD